MIYTALALLFMSGIAWSASRARRLRRYAEGVRRRHALYALFISKLGARSFVGVMADGQGLLLGDRRFERVFPFAEVESVEVLHSGEKGRLRRLIVRTTVKDEARPVHDYVLFDWPNGWGPKETQPHVKAMIEQAERIRLMVAQGMERTHDRR